ncbi:alpha-1,2-fucosyltransferase [Brachybacterium sp. Marseille-Q7125]|uniref:alpha-1,2-fucosyltransferase n=1 Tax=Brachybacterium sp. Marseille-Q7125 TaxID=2932815 RepID=UPI001FF36A15|nr:alpha-1,2-fucosyltransferase [Brachybacterium sp. Marseille-Q7125]
MKIHQRGRAIARAALEPVRNRPGARRYHYIRDDVRGGNILYFWQWAWLEQRRGHRAVIEPTTHASDWLAEFPMLGSLTADGPIGLLDRRELGGQWAFAVDFTAEENRDFCHALVSSSPSFQARRRELAEQVTPGTVVVNVRRGDYYSVPEHRQRFGMDIPRHVEQAIDLLAEPDLPINDVLVISDDITWCQDNLRGPLPTLRVLEDRRSMFDDLAALSLSTRLVLANSTFSYWASYIAAAFNPRHAAVAPPHHELLPDGTPTRLMFDPRWTRTTRSGS